VKHLLVAVSITFACLISVSLYAQSAQDQFTGNWLYQQYLGYRQERSPGFTQYTAYVAGVVDAHMYYREVRGSTPDWCAPKGAMLAQYFDIVGRYLEAHPEIRHMHRAQLVAMAISEAWPCKDVTR
jgi:hypothetical protein